MENILKKETKQLNPNYISIYWIDYVYSENHHSGTMDFYG